MADVSWSNNIQHCLWCQSSSTRAKSPSQSFVTIHRPPAPHPEAAVPTQQTLHPLTLFVPQLNELHNFHVLSVCVRFTLSFYLHTAYNYCEWFESKLFDLSNCKYEREQYFSRYYLLPVIWFSNRLSQSVSETHSYAQMPGKCGVMAARQNITHTQRTRVSSGS